MFKRIFNFLVNDADDPEVFRLLRRLGFGQAKDVARQAASSPFMQQELLKPENKGYLKAFVMYGYQFSKEVLTKFLLESDKNIVRHYLEHGRALDEESITAVLDRKDDDLIQVMLDEKIWCPFPFCSTYFANGIGLLNGCE